VLSPWQDRPYTTKNLQKTNTDFIHTGISTRNLILGVTFMQPREQKFVMQPTANHLKSPILTTNYIQTVCSQKLPAGITQLKIYDK